MTRFFTNLLNLRIFLLQDKLDQFPPKLKIFKSPSFVCKQEFRIVKEYLCRCFGSYKLREETKTLQSIT